MFDPFEDMTTKTAAKNGISAADLGATAMKVFRACDGLPAMAWTDLQPIDREPWQEVAVMAISIVDLPSDEKAVLEVSAKALAQRLAAQHRLARGLSTELMGENLLAWEAVGRHLANLIDSEGEIGWPELEEKIVEWYKSRAGAYQHA